MERLPDGYLTASESEVVVSLPRVGAHIEIHLATAATKSVQSRLDGTDWTFKGGVA